MNYDKSKPQVDYNQVFSEFTRRDWQLILDLYERSSHTNKVDEEDTNTVLSVIRSLID